MPSRLHGLRTVIYPAPDLSAAKAWWTAFVGQAPYFDEPFYVGFSLGGYELGLLSDADPSDGAQVYWGWMTSRTRSPQQSPPGPRSCHRPPT